MWAGAHTRPSQGYSEQEADEQNLALRTTVVMKKLAREAPESGVQEMISREIMEYIPEYKSRYKAGGLYAAGIDDDFRVLESHELTAPAKWGCEYNTWVVNVHVYCRWLLTNFIRRGGNLIQKKLAGLDEAFEIRLAGEILVVVVNCSGRNFDLDPKTYVMRGQTVLVRNTYHKTATRHNSDGSWTFLIPRPLGGGTIVEGTKQDRDSDTNIRPVETTSILASAVEHFPDFVRRVEDFEVVMVNVGMRPCREGGLRIEAEKRGGGRTVVHGYRAGARGYELGWAAAERIADLVEKQTLNRAAKL